MNAEGGSSRALAGSSDGRPQPNWRVDYSYGSSRGSSIYTSTQGTAYSTPSSITSVGPIDLSCRDGEQSEKLENILQEFHGTKDVSILDRWLSELIDVSRQGATTDAAATNLLHFAGSWMRALAVITETVGHMFLKAKGMLSRRTTILELGGEQHVLLVNSALFAETCILKILPLVDALVAPCSCNTRGEIVVVGDGAPAPAIRLRVLIRVHEAVSKVSQDILSAFYSTTSEEAQRIAEEIADLLLEKEAKLDEAVWSAMEQTTTRLLASTEDDDSPEGISPGIHKVTKAIMSYIDILSTNSRTMQRIADQATQLRGYVPKFDKVIPLISLIRETVSCLEEKLAEKSRSFPDQSLRFLFLINNSYFIQEQLNPIVWISKSYMADLAHKTDTYIETFLQVSWAPVLSCLCNSTPLCLGRSTSPAKFEAEFQKTYAAQKLWKVPDPRLRIRLRLAAIQKVVPSYKSYLEDNNISPSGITPRDLKDMLEGLFEG